MFSFVVPIRPLPAPRPRISRHGGVYNETWYIAYKNQIADVANRYTLGHIIEENIKMELNFYKNRPVNAQIFGDADNLAKAVMDALNGKVYKDDSQIVSLTVNKIHAQEERIEVKIWFD